MQAQVGTLPTPPASIVPTTTLAQALAYLQAASGGSLPPALAALAALAPAADRVPYYTGATTAALATLGTWARTDWLPVTSQSGARTALGLATVSWTGSYSDLAGAPTSLPASDVYAWAKQPSKPAYTYSEVGAAASSHAHADATPEAAGFLSASDKAKLDGIAANANDYTHPAGDGSLHVPATGTTNAGKVLTAGATAGSLSWQTPSGGGTLTDPPQHDYTQAGATSAWVLRESGGWRGVVTVAADSTTALTYSDRGGMLVSIDGVGCEIVPPGAGLVADERWPAGQTLAVLANQYLAVMRPGAGSVVLQGGKSVPATIIPPCGDAVKFVSFGTEWRQIMQAGVDRESEYAGGKSEDGMFAYHCWKAPDHHNKSSPISIEAVGGGQRSTGGAGALGRSGAYGKFALTNISAGECIEVMAGCNTSAAVTQGAATIIASPAGDTATLPSGAVADSALPTTTAGFDLIASSKIVTATSKAVTASSSNYLYYPGGGNPMGLPGQNTTTAGLHRGYGGAGPNGGTYSAGPGCARIKSASLMPAEECVFSLGVGATNGSTTFKDLSKTGATITRGGTTLPVHSSSKTFLGQNTISQNNGWLQVGSPAIFDFTQYKYARIAMRWMWAGGTGRSCLFDSRTDTGGSNGFGVFYRPDYGDISVYAREYYIISSPVSITANVFNLIEVEIIIGVGRALFRLWLNGQVIGYGPSTSLAAVSASDSLRLFANRDGSGYVPSADFCGGIAVYVSR